MHDAVARWNHIHIFECGFCPFDEMEAIFIATVFNVTVFLECIRFKATILDSK